MTTEQHCGLTVHDTILVATDGSENSDAALREAMAMAKSCHSQLFIQHVVAGNDELLALEPQRQMALEREAMEMLRAATAEAEAEAIRCESILTIEEQPAKAIVREARERKISLIVVGSHGRTGLKKLLMGSVCQQVIGHAPCPVLVVPGRHLLQDQK